MLLSRQEVSISIIMQCMGATVKQGDCAHVLKGIADNSIDLIITSPPYSDQRKETYGGISHQDYVQWFLPISANFYGRLKPTGTFILNIQEKVVNGERSTYVLKLILKKQGWLWSEEFIWYKKNGNYIHLIPLRQQTDK